MARLALCTATEHLVLGLELEKSPKLLTHSERSGLEHASRLMPRLDELMGQAGLGPGDLTALTVSLGPGSFTGLRIALAAAKGLSAALGLPLYGVGTLRALAWENPPGPGLRLALLDARRRRWYAQAFLDGRALSEPLDLDGPGLQSYLPGWGCQTGQELTVISPAGSRAQEQLSPFFPSETRWSESCDWARGLLALGALEAQAGRVLPEEAVPAYVRLSDAEEQKQGQGS